MSNERETGILVARSVARTLFAVAWAEQQGWPLMPAVFERLPTNTPVEATHMGMRICRFMVADSDIASTMNEAQVNPEMVGAFFIALHIDYDPLEADRDFTPELFGHYLALHALRIGEGLMHFGYPVSGQVVVREHAFSLSAPQNQQMATYAAAMMKPDATLTIKKPKRW